MINIIAVLWNKNARPITSKNFNNFLSIINGNENKDNATARFCLKTNKEL